MLEDVNGLYVKLVSYIPIRGSSYIGLPSYLQSMNCLLNKRNRDDNKYFLYCYVATWHFAHAQSLLENVGWLWGTNPETYSFSHPMIHQPVGGFEMLMAFNQIPRFPNLIKYQVNVFRYQKIDLIPLRYLKRQDLPFILDLLVLRDCQAFHFVSIKDLNLQKTVWKRSSYMGSTQDRLSLLSISAELVLQI